MGTISLMMIGWALRNKIMTVRWHFYSGFHSYVKKMLFLIMINPGGYSTTGQLDLAVRLFDNWALKWDVKEQGT